MVYVANVALSQLSYEPKMFILHGFSLAVLASPLPLAAHLPHKSPLPHKLGLFSVKGFFHGGGDSCIPCCQSVAVYVQSGGSPRVTEPCRYALDVRPRSD
jgi:hypothetical protein